ncbi:MAG: IclR family transcriptional regulator [Pseudomonadota bacterium]
MSVLPSDPATAPADKAAGKDRSSQLTERAVDTRKGVQSVDHAFKILRIMEETDRPLAIKELSERCGMPPSKVHHYLVSLVRSGVVRQNSNGNYDLGTFALHLGLAAIRKLDVIALGSKAAESLRDRSGKPVFIAVWGSQGATIVRYFEGFRPVTVEVRAGLILPVFTSATGKVFLAWGNQRQVEAVGQEEQQVSAARIEELRAATRSVGLGRVDGDLLPRIASLSAPVFDRDDNLVLALTTLGWIEEFDTDPSGETATELRTAADRLSRELGYSAR